MAATPVSQAMLVVMLVLPYEVWTGLEGLPDRDRGTRVRRGRHAATGQMPPALDNSPEKA
jgi:hypothetical protein